MADLGNPEVWLAQKQTEMIIASLLDDLPERERDIIRSRFGFEGEPETLAAIGQRIGRSKDRVRQIEALALRKFDRPSCKDRIRAAWLDAPPRPRLPKRTPPPIEAPVKPPRFFVDWFAELKKDPRLEQIGRFEPADFHWPFFVGMNPDQAAEFAVRFNAAPNDAIKNMICREYRIRVAREEDM